MSARPAVKFRLLPLLILLCLALLVLRVADIIDRDETLAEALFATSSRAEEMSETPGVVDKSPETPERVNEKVMAEKEAAEGGDEDGEEGEEHGESTPPVQKTSINPLDFSKTEIEILQRLAKRREKLVQWEKEMEMKENLLNITESRLDNKLEELKALKQNVESLLSEYKAEEDAKIRSLVKIYENMKPKDAAPILESLKMEILLEVIDNMKEARVAPILAKMSPARAQEITALYAMQKKLPINKN